MPDGTAGQDQAEAVHPLGCFGRVGPHFLKDRENRYVMIDSIVVRAHQQALRHREQGLRRPVWGRSRGGLTTKVHLLADEVGLSLCFVLIGGQTDDCTQAIALLGGRILEAVLADKG